jgi:hypothetical protein
LFPWGTNSISHAQANYRAGMPVSSGSVWQGGGVIGEQWYIMSQTDVFSDLSRPEIVSPKGVLPIAYPSNLYPLIMSSSGFHPEHALGGSPFTAPVDSFRPNGYGLYNMFGNVAEILSDLGDAVGGSYYSQAAWGLSSYGIVSYPFKPPHNFENTLSTGPDIGFRLARTKIEEEQ